MVECEYRCLWWTCLVYQVLIDTWWNVNVREYILAFDPDDVLIDTWWNVNKFTIFIFCTTDPRFNRYMVECES